MTRNRFVIFQDSYDDLYIQDKEVYRATGIKVGNKEDIKYENVLKIVELLNELSEENQSIKIHIEELYDMIKHDVDNGIEVYPKLLVEYIQNILKIIGDLE